MAFNNANGSQKIDNAQADINQFAEVGRQGYAQDSNALGDGIASVAAPLFGSGGKLHGVLCIVGPEFRLPQDVIQKQILNPLLDTCGIISSKLGWHSPHSPRRT